MSKSVTSISILSLISLLMAAFFYWDLYHLLTFEQLQAQKERLASYYLEHRLKTELLFFASYVFVTSLSIPAATVLTLAGGFLFGFLKATILISLASTIGATFAFWGSRFLLKDWVQNRFGAKLNMVNEGIKKEGGFYLFTLRLFPLFPFFAINLLMGLTPYKTWKYFLISLISMLPVTLVYVNAGTQLSQVHSMNDILSLDLVFAFALLGITPLALKRLVKVLRRKYGKSQQPPPP